MAENMKFELLASSIKEISAKASNAAKRAVNQSMTLRNWAIGYYIVEYEQGGSDRAEYGANLLKNLEKQIDEKGINGVVSFILCILKLVRQCRTFLLYLLIQKILRYLINLKRMQIHF